MKIVSISETSLLYSRVRNERGQIGNSGSGGSGSAAASSLVTGAGPSSSSSSAAVNIGGSTDGRVGAVPAGTASASGVVASASGGTASAAQSDRDSFSRWRDRQYYGPRRWFTSSREDSQWDKESGMMSGND